MKKAFKATVSVMMAVLLLFGTASAAFAEQSCSCGHAPVVFVDGIGTTLYSTDENGEEYTVFPIESDKMTSDILRFIPVAVVSLVFGGWDSMSDSLVALLNSLFADVACDNNGDSVRDVYTDEPDAAELSVHTGGSNEYDFCYDWRLDPYVNAARLEAYIDEIIAVTGHDKVILSAFSEGGEVTLAYLDEYGSDKIEKYIARCSAFQGLTLIGEVFTMNVGTDGTQLANFLVTMLATSGTDEGVLRLLDVLRYTGIYSAVSGLVNGILDKCFEDVYYGFARDCFATMPGIFGFVPAEYFDEAVDMLFGNKLHYAKLVERLTKYHNAQVNAEKILKNAQAEGMAVVLISNYGCYPMPLVGEMAYQSDSLIDSSNTSGGATFAPMGAPFDASYKQKVDDGHGHVSPDGTVDASTCMFPESTWFVSGFNHWNVPEDLIDWLVECDGQPTVYDNSDFPQFLVGNPTENTVSVMK